MNDHAQRIGRGIMLVTAIAIVAFIVLLVIAAFIQGLREEPIVIIVLVGTIPVLYVLGMVEQKYDVFSRVDDWLLEHL